MSTRAVLASLVVVITAGCSSESTVAPVERQACGPLYVECIQAMTPTGLHDHDESWKMGLYHCLNVCEAVPGFERKGTVWRPCSEAELPDEKRACGTREAPDGT